MWIHVNECTQPLVMVGRKILRGTWITPHISQIIPERNLK
jgi:hypothetical protein